MANQSPQSPQSTGNNQAADQIRQVNTEIGYLEDQLISIADRLSNTIKQSIEDIRDESAGVAQIFERNLTRSIKDISRESDTILNNTLKLAKGEAKIADIKKSAYNIQLKELSARRNLDNLLRTGVITEQQKAAAEAEITDSVNKQNKLLEDQLNLAKQIQNNMGLTGKMLKSISKIPILGDLIDAETALAAAQLEAAKEGSNRTKVMGAAFKQLGKSLKENLTDPLVMAGVFIKTLKTLSNIAFDFSQRVADTARNFGISSDAAYKMQMYYLKVSQTRNLEVGNAKDIAEANERINNELGLQVGLSEDVLVDQVELKKRLGLSADELNAMYKFSMLTGKSQEDIYNEVNATGGKLGNNKKILQDVLKVSGRLLYNYQGDVKALGDAVWKAQQLGLTMDQTRKTSDGLLDFEQSISNELEAELLLGKDLNLEEARLLAMKGKTAEAAESIMKQLGGSAEFGNLLVPQQEAIAKLLNMQVDEYADALAKSEQIKKIKEDELATTGLILTDEEAAAKLKETNLSASEKLAEAMAQMKESLSSMLAGPLTKIIDKVTGAIVSLNESPIAKQILKYTGGIVGAFALVGSALAVARTLIRGFTGIQKVFVTNMGAMGGGDALGGGGGGKPGRGGTLAKLGGGFAKLFGGKSTSLGRGIRNLTAGATRAFRGGGTLGKIGSGLGKIGGKILGAGTSLAMTGKGIYDFFADSKLMKTGFGGFLESMGGTGMHILDTLTFGATKALGNYAGWSIPGMDTDDVASARAIFHDSGRDPDDSRFPISTDNKQLIQDIIAHPGSYPEGIVQQAQGVDLTKLAIGGIVNKPTRALVGEAGPEAVIPLTELYKKFDQLIEAYRMGSTVYLDSSKVGQTLAMSDFKTQ